MKLDGTFDLATARVLLAACAETYRTEGSGTAGVERVQTALAHACVIGQPDCVIVAFRGSRSLRDWLTDFEFRRVDIGAGEKVHEGFWRAAQSVEGLIKQKLAELPPSQGYGASREQEPGARSKQPIFVTGHSLGGALALLAAESLFKAGYPVAGVYTFGGPRVGNGAWAEGYDLLLRRCTWRLVDELDIVPRVPVLGYRHAGHRVQLGAPIPAPLSALVIDPPLWLTLLSDAVGIYRAYRAKRVAQLADHPLTAYEARLEQAIAVDAAPADAPARPTTNN